MPENQSQPRSEALNNPQGSPQPGAEAHGAEAQARPSDTEAAHAPQEGADVSGGDPLTAGMEVPNAQKDRHQDYGGGSMGHSRPGADAGTAGARFADRLPEASSTQAAEGERPGARKSPGS